MEKCAAERLGQFAVSTHLALKADVAQTSWLRAHGTVDGSKLPTFRSAFADTASHVDDTIARPTFLTGHAASEKKLFRIRTSDVSGQDIPGLQAPCSVQHQDGVVAIAFDGQPAAWRKHVVRANGLGHALRRPHQIKHRDEDAPPADDSNAALRRRSECPGEGGKRVALRASQAAGLEVRVDEVREPFRLVLDSLPDRRVLQLGDLLCIPGDGRSWARRQAPQIVVPRRSCVAPLPQQTQRKSEDILVSPCGCLEQLLVLLICVA
mmetsp:Transcript_106878/g.300499  ORF Transcript_106878/g.300499 Transcript_106878/m.300499 type:complete len:265 (+) Transcript_106878:479-1273(+)